MELAEGENFERRGVLLNRLSGKVEAISPRPVSSSNSLGWKGYMLEEHSFSLDGGAREVLMLNTVVLVQLNHPTTIDYREHSRFVTKRVLPGRVSIRPSRATVAFRSADKLDFLAFSFEPGFIEMACGEFEKPERLEIGVHNAVEDKLTEGICMSIAAVAVEVGFYDQSHFAQHFKRVHGVTPRQFAEQYRPRKKVGEPA